MSGKNRLKKISTAKKSGPKNFSLQEFSGTKKLIAKKSRTKISNPKNFRPKKILSQKNPVLKISSHKNFPAHVAEKMIYKRGSPV